jgi:glycosyltransferase involved in cell wall biosynthesis
VRVGVLLEQLHAPVPGGTGRYTAELAAALVRTADADADTVTGFTAWHRYVGDAAVPGVGGPVALRLPRRALTAAWEHGVGPAPAGVDLVHAPTQLFPPRRVPLVVTIHDTVPWTHPETLTPRGVRWHRRTAARAARIADAIAVPTQAVAHELLDQLAGLAMDRVHVLGAGVAAALRVAPTEADVATVVRRLALPERFLLTVATVEPRKGLDVALQALARLGPGAAPLLVVGPTGWGNVDVPTSAAAAGLPPEQVRVLGRISDHDLGVVLRRATVLLMPSRAEGFGLPVAEAMVCGTPVICSDVPALVEVAAGAALVTPVGDVAKLAEAIEAVLTDAELRDWLIRAGRSRVSAFDWDEVGRRAWRLYRTLG